MEGKSVNQKDSKKSNSEVASLQRVFSYPFLAFGLDADDGLSFGLVHNDRPLIAPCQTNTNLVNQFSKTDSADSLVLTSHIRQK